MSAQGTSREVTLTVRGQKWGGWQGVRITRGIERCPSDFALTLSERWPDQPGEMFALAGDPVIVSIGDDPVITGYIDRVMPTLSARGHEIHVLGRGRCADLVDCSAIADNSQFVLRSVFDIATMVAAPYNIKVVQTDTGTAVLPNQPRANDGGIIPQLNVTLVDTPWAIIEQITRFAALLAYEDTAGNVVLSSVGTRKHVSGFEQGVNVQAASAHFGADMRYSEYTAVALAIDIQTESGLPRPTGTMSPANRVATVHDEPASAFKRHDGTPRRRPLIIVSEQGNGSLDVVKIRANWEAARRLGRSQAVTVTCDTWHDAAGRLWTPNMTADVVLPRVHIDGKGWLISEVTFSVDTTRGRVADVTLMPKQAFIPAPPPVLNDGQLLDAITEGARQQNATRPDFNPRLHDTVGGF